MLKEFIQIPPEKEHTIVLQRKKLEILVRACYIWWGEVVVREIEEANLQGDETSVYLCST